MTQKLYFQVYTQRIESRDPQRYLYTHVHILRTYKYITLHGKRDFAGVINVKDLEWGYYPGLSEWGQYNHMNP